MHSLNEGQKIAFDIGANPKNGKSSDENLRAVQSEGAGGVLNALQSAHCARTVGRIDENHHASDRGRQRMQEDKSAWGLS